MTITKLETILVGAPTPGCGLLSNRNYFYILLHTDEAFDRYMAFYNEILNTVKEKYGVE